MLSQPRIKAFLPTVKPELSKQFFLNILGLKLISEDDYAIEFIGKGASLRITVVDKFEPHSFTVLGFQVDDIDSDVKSLIKQKINFERYSSHEQDDLGIWTSPSNARIAWFKDPDGNLLSLTQYAL